MGSATILSGGEGGQYSISLTYSDTDYTAEISRIDNNVAALNARLATVEVNTSEYYVLKMNIASMELRKSFLQANAPSKTMTAWCADLTEDLTGTVGTIEIPNEVDSVNICPGVKSHTIGGILKIPDHMKAANAFYNCAILPGWQKWSPLARYATVDSITGPRMSLSIEAATSSQQGLDVNADDIDLSSVGASYMTCGAAAFEEGDSVIVLSPRTAPLVIGFKDNPQPCPECPSCASLMEVDGEDVTAADFKWGYNCIDEGDSITLKFGGNKDNEECRAELDTLTDGAGGTFDNYQFSEENDEWEVTYTAASDLCDGSTCPEICTFEFSCCFDWYDEENLPETMERNDVEILRVHRGRAPYTWAISGTGFSLDEETGAAVVVRTDGTACGAGTVTVTDDCGNSVSHTIRATEGQWVFIEQCGSFTYTCSDHYFIWCVRGGQQTLTVLGRSGGEGACHFCCGETITQFAGCGVSSSCPTKGNCNSSHTDEFCGGDNGMLPSPIYRIASKLWEWQC